MSEQEQKLRNEILDDARRKADRARTRAERDAEKTRKQTEADQQAERQTTLAKAAERAAAQSRAVLVTVNQEIRRRRLLAREEVIERCLDDALASIDHLPDAEAKQSLGELLLEALAALGSGAATARVRSADVAALTGPQLAALGIAPDSLNVVADDTISGGIVVESSDGLRQFDNTYATRRRRLRERLRTLLAGEIEF